MNGNENVPAWLRPREGTEGGDNQEMQHSEQNQVPADGGGVVAGVDASASPAAASGVQVGFEAAAPAPAGPTVFAVTPQPALQPVPAAVHQPSPVASPQPGVWPAASQPAAAPAMATPNLNSNFIYIEGVGLVEKVVPGVKPAMQEGGIPLVVAPNMGAPAMQSVPSPAVNGYPAGDYGQNQGFQPVAFPRNIVMLYADPDHQNCSIMSELEGYFPKGNLKIVPAWTGQMAMQHAETWKPDVALVHHNMPFQDGFAVAKRIQEMGRGTIIIMATDSSVNTQTKARNMDVHYILPLAGNERLTPERLVTEVHRALADAAAGGRGPRRSSVSARPVEPAGASGSVHVVWGAKGGIGKSTICQNLALIIAKFANRSNSGQKVRVALWEMDMTYPTQDLAFNLQNDRRTPDLARNYDATRKDFKDDSVLDSILYPYGNTELRILLGPASPLESVDVKTEHVDAVLALLRRHFDFVFVDMGTDYGHEVALRILETAHKIHLVTDTDWTSVRNTQRAIEDFQTEDFDIPINKFNLIINGAADDDEYSSDEIQGLIGLPAVVIPYDRATARKSRDKGAPIAEHFQGTGIFRALYECAMGICPLPSDVIQQSYSGVTKHRSNSSGSNSGSQGGGGWRSLFSFGKKNADRGQTATKANGAPRGRR